MEPKDIRNKMTLRNVVTAPEFAMPKRLQN